MERDDPMPEGGPAVGIDLGLKSFAVLSDGARLESPKPLAKVQRRLRHRQRLHSRKPRGSRNRRKSAAGLARLHRRIRCQRTDFLHKATTKPAKTESVIVVEDPDFDSFGTKRPGPLCTLRGRIASPSGLGGLAALQAVVCNVLRRAPCTIWHNLGAPWGRPCAA